MNGRLPYIRQRVLLRILTGFPHLPVCPGQTRSHGAVWREKLYRIRAGVSISVQAALAAKRLSYFTVIHIQQFRLARTAFQIEVWQDGLKKTAEVVKLSAKAILRMLQQLSKDPDADITLCPLPPFRDKKGQNLIPYKIQHRKAGMGGYRPFSGT